MSSFNSTIWRYHFNVVSNGFSNVQGATHRSEVPLTFYNLPGNGHSVNPLNGERGSDVIKMAQIIFTMWISFVNTGNPNSFVREVFTDVSEVLTWLRY